MVQNMKLLQVNDACLFSPRLNLHISKEKENLRCTLLEIRYFRA